VSQVRTTSRMAHLTGPATPGLGSPPTETGELPHVGCNGGSRPILTSPTTRWLGDDGYGRTATQGCNLGHNWDWKLTREASPRRRALSRGHRR
jgi:hypothetical protein